MEDNPNILAPASSELGTAQPQLVLPLFWIHYGYFEYKSFSGMFWKVKILMKEVVRANKSIVFKHTQQSQINEYYLVPKLAL